MGYIYIYTYIYIYIDIRIYTWIYHPNGQFHGERDDQQLRFRVHHFQAKPYGKSPKIVS